ncbi:cysteine-rich CWC family protein [Leeia oryzae]|uniref:cysteine-rich CWC family protein n=1 Tax=Leeia oryzae TaxID=356662 RepID=UPI00357174B9
MIPESSTTCPLCGGNNQCAPAICGRLDVDCWCSDKTFPPALLAQVPADLKHKVCICAACLEKAQTS